MRAEATSHGIWNHKGPRAVVKREEAICLLILGDAHRIYLSVSYPLCYSVRQLGVGVLDTFQARVPTESPRSLAPCLSMLHGQVRMLSRERDGNFEQVDLGGRRQLSEIASYRELL
jgi:hypothetical protein